MNQIPDDLMRFQWFTMMNVCCGLSANRPPYQAPSSRTLISLPFVNPRLDSLSRGGRKNRSVLHRPPVQNPRFLSTACSLDLPELPRPLKPTTRPLQPLKALLIHLIHTPPHRFRMYLAGRMLLRMLDIIDKTCCFVVHGPTVNSIFMYKQFIKADDVGTVGERFFFLLYVLHHALSMCHSTCNLFYKNIIRVKEQTSKLKVFLLSIKFMMEISRHMMVLAFT